MPTDPIIRQSTPDEGPQLADTLGEKPDAVFAAQLLRRGIRTAWLTGDRAHPQAVVVPTFANAYLGFGDDPATMKRVLDAIPQWASIRVIPQIAGALRQLIEDEGRSRLNNGETLYYTLTTPVVHYSDPSVRLLTPDDAPQLAFSTGGAVGAAYGGMEQLLREGIVAGAFSEGRIVARAHTSCQSARYAEVSVATAEDWRGKGLATAVSSLVCEQIQRRGHIPIWSTSGNNLPSQRIAQKCGFAEVGRYVVLTVS